MVIWMEHCNSDALKAARLSEGAFLVIDNRVLNGPLGRSICSFTRTPHSAHSICSARRAFHGVASSAAARNDIGAYRKIEEERNIRYYLGKKFGSTLGLYYVSPLGTQNSYT